MYSANGNFIKKNNIIEHYKKPVIDTEALKKKSDEQGGTTLNDSSYLETTGGITQTTEIEKQINFINETSSSYENVSIIDKTSEVEINQEIMNEKTATLEESINQFQSNEIKVVAGFVEFCDDCGFKNCRVKLEAGEYPDLSQYDLKIQGPNAISSLGIPSEIKLTIFSEINFGGKKWEIMGPNNISCLVHFDWNDIIASAKIENMGGLVIFAGECGFKSFNVPLLKGEYPDLDIVDIPTNNNFIEKKIKGIRIEIDNKDQNWGNYCSYYEIKYEHWIDDISVIKSKRWNANRGNYKRHNN